MRGLSEALVDLAVSFLDKRDTLAKISTHSSPHSPPPALTPIGCSPTNSRARRKQPARAWPRCSTTPGPATPSSLPQSTVWDAPSPKSPAPLLILSIVESHCAPCGKGSTQPPRPDELSRRSWPPSPSSSSSSAKSAAPHRANPAELGSCRRPSHRSSPPTGKSSSAGSPRPANP
jgi:hypothetical protein